MAYRISGLSPEPFRHLFGLSDAELARQGAQRWIAEAGARLPDRVELRDAEPGERVILVNYEHQPAATPFRASHAIFVLEGATTPCEAIDHVPEAMRSRVLSLRGFDAAHLMVDASLVDGSVAEAAIVRMLADPRVAYIQAHYATRGCYAARIERTGSNAP
jgi:hypothetical protein